MSPSARNASGSRATIEPVGSRPERSGRWWLCSLSLHVALYLALLYLTPLRQIVFKPPEPKTTVDVTLDRERIEEVADYIRERSQEHVVEKVEDLLAIEEELEELLEAKMEEFRQFQAEMLQSAPEEALEAQQEALKAQQKALDLQRQTLQAQAGVDLAQARQRQSEVELAQARAREAQARAQKALGWTSEALAEARKAQDVAIERQTDADQGQSAARQALGQARQAAERAPTQQLPELERRAAEAQKSLAAAEAAQEKARSALEAARTRAAQSRDRATRNALRGAEAALRTATSRLRKTERDAQRAGKTLEAGKARIEAAKAAAADTRRAQDQARQSQQAARQAQKRAAESLARAIAGGTSARNEAKPAETTPASETRSWPSLSRMDLAQLYDASVRAEQQTADAYKRLRAAELSMLRSVPIAQALGATQVARPIRPQLDRQLLAGRPTTGQALQAQRKEIERAIQEIDSMRSLGHTMLAAARGLVAAGQRGFAVSLDQVRARADYYSQLEQLAAEDSRARAKDLSALMKGAAASGKAAQGSPTTAQAAAPGGGPVPTKAGTGGGWGGPPGISPKSFVALPARRVLSRGAQADWLFVDSWYCIGPFPNPQRRNIDTKYPPESIVDLDATYEGKDDRRVRWEFMQGVRMPCVPLHAEPYAIYYAYTELYLDRPRDLWVAIGSDDKSKLWVNDQLVWVSRSQLKSWRVDEALRKVHFRKGHNRVLFRVENGHGGTAFSLTVYVGRHHQ